MILFNNIRYGVTLLIFYTLYKHFDIFLNIFIFLLLSFLIMTFSIAGFVYHRLFNFPLEKRERSLYLMLLLIKKAIERSLNNQDFIEVYDSLC